MSDSKKYPGQTDEAFPDVFNKIPPQPMEKKDGQLSEEMIRKFFEEGYLVVNDYFPIDLLEKCKERIEKLVDELANKLYAAGKIKDLHKDSGIYERLIKLNNEFPGAAITITKGGYLHEEVAALWSNERLLNLVEQLIGPDIAGHVVWNLRSKIPRYEQTTVPWHQDNGYLDDTSYNVLQPTAWIPLLDITKENGALQVRWLSSKLRAITAIKKNLHALVLHMESASTGKTDNSAKARGYLKEISSQQFIRALHIMLDILPILSNVSKMARRGHKTGRIATHTCCAGDTWYINLDEKEMEETLGVDLDNDIMTLPVKYGGMILFSNIIPHRSLQNLSNQVRWSFDLRWHAADKSNGFYGLKESVIMRRAAEPNLKIDWDGFNKVNRHKEAPVVPTPEDDYFDTTVSGPWMGRWEMVHENRHTDAYKKAGALKWHAM